MTDFTALHENQLWILCCHYARLMFEVSSDIRLPGDASEYQRFRRNAVRLPTLVAQAHEAGPGRLADQFLQEARATIHSLHKTIHHPGTEILRNSERTEQADTLNEDLVESINKAIRDNQNMAQTA